MKVLWTEEAFRRLREISEFISFDSPKNAATLINKLIERGESLEKFPKLGRIVPEIASETIREIIEENYRIVYRVQDQSTIQILTVFECRRELPDVECLTKKTKPKKK